MFVRLFTGESEIGTHVTITYNALDLTIQGPLAYPHPDIRHQTWYPFARGLAPFPSTWHWHLVASIETCGDHKQAIRILLECFLVLNIFSISVSHKRLTD